MASYQGNNKDGSVGANVPQLIKKHYDPIARLIACNIQL